MQHDHALGGSVHGHPRHLDEVPRSGGCSRSRFRLLGPFLYQPISLFVRLAEGDWRYHYQRQQQQADHKGGHHNITSAAGPPPSVMVPLVWDQATLASIWD